MRKSSGIKLHSINRYRNAVNQYAHMIRQRYPEHELKVEVTNHPVPQLKQVFILLKNVKIIIYRQLRPF